MMVWRVEKGCLMPTRRRMCCPWLLVKVLLACESKRAQHRAMLTYLRSMWLQRLRAPTAWAAMPYCAVDLGAHALMRKMSRWQVPAEVRWYDEWLRTTAAETGDGGSFVNRLE